MDRMRSHMVAAARVDTDTGTVPGGCCFNRTALARYPSSLSCHAAICRLGGRLAEAGSAAIPGRASSAVTVKQAFGSVVARSVLPALAHSSALWPVTART